jgi:hypothetical protein
MMSGGQPPQQPPRGQPPQGLPPQQTFDFRRQGGDAYNRYGNPSEQQQQWQQQPQWAGAQGRRSEPQRQEPWRGAEPPWPPQAQSRRPSPAQQQVLVGGGGPAAHQWRARAGRYTGPPPLLSPEARLALEGFGPNGYLAPQQGYHSQASQIELQAELDQVQTLSPLAFNIMHHYKGQPAA